MLELLQKYPEASVVVKSYYLEKMLDGLNDEKLPDNFKEFVRELGLEDERLSKMVESSPRALFDVFDENGIFIEIMYMEKMFHYTIFNEEEIVVANTQKYSSRKEAEYAAVADAFLKLNTILNENRSNSGPSDSEVPTEE